MTTHGLTGSSTSISWAAMKARCLDEKHAKYHRYGGRGIIVCARWLGPDGFSMFVLDMGVRPDGMEIDRIDNDGNYEPSNCRWATHKEQTRKRNTTRWVVFGGKKMSLAELSERTGVRYHTLHNRLNGGLSVERAVAIGNLSRGQHYGS